MHVQPRSIRVEAHGYSSPQGLLFVEAPICNDQNQLAQVVRAHSNAACPAAVPSLSQQGLQTGQQLHHGLIFDGIVLQAGALWSAGTLSMVCLSSCTHFQHKVIPNRVIRHGAGAFCSGDALLEVCIVHTYAACKADIVSNMLSCRWLSAPLQAGLCSMPDLQEQQQDIPLLSTAPHANREGHPKQVQWLLSQSRPKSNPAPCPSPERMSVQGLRATHQMEWHITHDPHATLSASVKAIPSGSSDCMLMHAPSPKAAFTPSPDCKTSA